MKPSVEWMRQKYDEMNQLLFGGELGDCTLEVFTSGKGASGNVLGWFSVGNKGLFYDKRTGQMYVESYFGLKKNITRENFVELFKPVIKLNGNYSWTEKSMLTTLVHEMCHYYTYMDGIKPRQGHGPEFKHIAGIVSRKSNNFFTIQRLANAEVMSELELDSEIAKRNKEKIDRKKSKLNAVLFKNTKGVIGLTMTSHENVIVNVYNAVRYTPRYVWVKKSNDKDLINTLYQKGYNRDFRTWRWWEINPDTIKLISSFGENIWTTLWSKEENTSKPKEENVNKQKFRVKTTSGDVTIDFSDENELFDKIKKMFPKLKDEVIRKLMDNKANYITENNKSTTDIIIENIIKNLIKEKSNEEFIDDENDDSIPLSPFVNYGVEDF